MDHEEVPLLIERVGQKPMLMCPWCEEWAPRDTFTALQMPDDFRAQLSPIYKHGGVDGCKRLFALRAHR